jgi:hypothetical protein
MQESCRVASSGSHGQRNVATEPHSPNQALSCPRLTSFRLVYIDDRYIDKRLYRGATGLGNSFLYLFVENNAPVECSVAATEVRPKSAYMFL